MLFSSPHLLLRAVFVKTAIYYLTASKKNHPLTAKHYVF